MESHEVANKCPDDSIKSISRIIEYPVIKDSFSKAGEYYNWIKGQNSTISNTLNWTENAVKDVVHKVEPLAASHLETLDKYACTKLDTLETNYPIVKESSEEVLKSSSEYYESNIKPRVDSAKDSVVYVAATPYRITTQTIEVLSSTATNFVGKYMGTAPNTTSPQQTYDATFKKAVKEIDTIRNYTMANVQHLTRLLSTIYNKTVTNNEEWIRKYYDEFRSELDTKNSAQSTEIDTNSKLMHLALHLSNKMRVSVRAMSTVCYNHLSTEYREKLDLVFAKTEQLYNNVNKSTYETVREQISMENVQWIGQTTLGIMNSVKDAMIQRYKDSTGKDVTADLVDDDTCAGDSAEHSTEATE